MEWELSALCKMTGFSKKQISDWAKAGIIPKSLRIDNRGNQGGRIPIYPDETLNRLLMLKGIPVNSLTKKSTIGISGLGFMLFIFGYNDTGIRENIKKFINQAIDNIMKSFRKFEKGPQKNLHSYADFFGFILPEIALNAMIARMFYSFPQKEIDKMFPRDDLYGELNENFEDELFDNSLDFIKKLILNEEESGELAAMYPEEFCNQISRLKPIKEIKKEIDNLSDLNFIYLQACYMLLLGLQVQFGLSANKIASSFFKANELSAIAVYGFYGYKMFVKAMKNNRGLEKSLLELPQKAILQSDKIILHRKKQFQKNSKREKQQKAII